jgi:hypothetical protein
MFQTLEIAPQEVVCVDCCVGETGKSLNIVKVMFMYSYRKNIEQYHRRRYVCEGKEG